MKTSHEWTTKHFENQKVDIEIDEYTFSEEVYIETYAAIGTGNWEEGVIEEQVYWGDQGILNLWFSHLAEERLMGEGKYDLDPCKTMVTMCVSRKEVQEFLADCHRLLNDHEHTPYLFRHDGNEDYLEFLDDIDEVPEVAREIEQFLAEHDDEAFLYIGNYDFYPAD